MTDANKFLYGERGADNDPMAQADQSTKKLVWVPAVKNGFEAGSLKESGDECVVELASGPVSVPGTFGKKKGFSRPGPVKDLICYHCQQRGHWASVCPLKGPKLSSFCHVPHPSHPASVVEGTDVQDSRGLARNKELRVEKVMLAREVEMEDAEEDADLAMLTTSQQPDTPPRVKVM
ncbi:unnamed protein product [Arctogadus glacialis]